MGPVAKVLGRTCRLSAALAGLAAILSEYLCRYGSLEAGLQYYNGAALDGTARYAQKVLAERERLRQALSSS